MYLYSRSTLVTYFASVGDVGAGVNGQFYFKQHKRRVAKDRGFLSKGCFVSRVVLIAG
jgi:hypothetical protein